MSPRRKLNSTAVASVAPMARAARIVTSERLVPGHMASTWATPMIRPWRQVSSVIRSPGRSGLIFGASHRSSTPPITHAAMTGHGPKRWSLIFFSRATPDDDRREERQHQGDEEPAAVGVLADQALEDGDDALPVQDQHGEDGAELDGDGVGVGGVLGGAGVADAEDALGDEQVAGRAHRQVLGDTLDHAEHHGLPGRHLRVRQRRCPAASSSSRRARCPTPGPRSPR